jgi:hypothetical protein
MREEGYERRSRWGRLRAFLGVVTVAFAVTLALVVGNRLSSEALGVLAGAVCGVGAAIPTSLIVVAVTRRRDQDESGHGEMLSRQRMERNTYPPVIVVSPQSGRERPYQGWDALPPSLSAPMERNFKVVGGASANREGMRYGD